LYISTVLVYIFRSNIATMTKSIFTHSLNQWWTTSSAPTAALTGLGFLTAVSVAYNIFSFIHLYTKPSKLNRYLHSSSEGKQPWALVTGATDGIGKAFAHELASRGFNVVAHGRNPSKLAATVDELRSAHPERQFRSLLADASRVPCVNCLEKDEKAVDFGSIATSLSNINLTVLVSNAGGGPHPVYRTLDDMPQRDITGNIALNALFPVHLLSHLIPALARNSPALVIIIGSLSDNGLPLQSTYGPSKKFLMSLAGVLARDIRLEGRDVEVLGLRAGRVTDVSHYKARPSLMEPDAKTWVRAALGRVGCGRAEVVPYWGHAVQQSLGVEMMPAWVRERMFAGVMRGLRDEERERLGLERKGE
jgi:17beta-estradiol 17-dehydrogenase / very-long-chain 3-oxoacyl-CoA reductase